MKSKKKSESLMQEIFKNKKISSPDNLQAKPEARNTDGSKIFISNRTTLASKRSNMTTTLVENDYIQRSKSHASIDPSSFILSSRVNFHSPRALTRKAFQEDSIKSHNNIVTTDLSKSNKSQVTSFGLVPDQSSTKKKSFLSMSFETKPFSPSRPITSKSPTSSVQLFQSKRAQAIHRKVYVRELNFSKIELKDFLILSAKNMKSTAESNDASRVTLNHFNRIIQAIVRDLQHSSKKKHELLALNPNMEYEKYLELEYEYFDKDSSMVERCQNSCQLLLVKTEDLVSSHSKLKSRRLLDEALSELSAISRESENFEIQLYFIKMWGKIARERKDYLKAHYLFSQLKQLSDSFSSVLNKIRALKNLGYCFQDQMKYIKALSSFTKMVEYAWIAKDKRYELLAYDLIAKQYFYMNCMEKALFYHDKFMSGRVEPENSELHKLGISRVKDRTSSLRRHKIRRPSRIQASPMLSEFLEPDQFGAESSEEEPELPLPKEYNEIIEKIYKNQQNMTLHLDSLNVKSGKTLMVKKKEVDITSIFKKKEHDRHRIMAKSTDTIKMSTFTSETFYSLSDKILLSHLSPNRDLKNFTNYASSRNTLLKREEESIDIRTGSVILKMLQKFQKNIEAVLEVLSCITPDRVNMKYEYKKPKTEIKRTYNGFSSNRY